LSVLAILLASCERSVNAPADDIRSVPVVVYAAYDDHSYLPEYFEAFTARNGIRVIVRHSEGIVDEVIDNSGSPPADVLLTRDVAGIWRAADEGALRPLTTAANRERLPAWLRDPDDYWAAISYRTSDIAYDSRVVELVVPASYEDLAAARFRGQLCLSSSSESANRAVIAMLIEKLGVRPAEIVVRGWMANLAMPVLDSETKLLEAIQSSQCRIGIASSVGLAKAMAAHADAVVRSAAVADSYADIEGVGIARHAKNPEAAATLIEWMFSDVAQVSHSKWTRSYPAVDTDERADVSRQNIATVARRTEDAIRLAERAGYR